MKKQPDPAEYLNTMSWMLMTFDSGLGAVSIGLVAVHNTNPRYDVTFDKYTFTRFLEKKK